MSLSPSRKQRLQSILEQLGRLSIQKDGSNEVCTDVAAAATVRGRKAGEAAAASLHPPLPISGGADDMNDSDLFLGDERSLDAGGSSSGCSNTFHWSGNGKSTPAGAIRSDKQSLTNLFITNLPHRMGQSDLKTMFAPYGEILSAAVMRNIHTGDSLGTAFVRYATTRQAEMAIAGLSGKKLNGKTMVVQWAKRQHDGTPVGEARKKISKLFVRNIPLDVTVGDLSELFTPHGPVKSVSIHKDTTPDIEKNSERHIAFVTFLVDGVAEKAAEAVHNTRPFPSCGKVPLMVKLAEDTPQHSHHNNGNTSLNNALKGNKRTQRGGGKSSPGQVRLSATSAVKGVYPVGSDMNTVPGVLPVGSDVSNRPSGTSSFFPSVIPAAGFFVSPSFPGVGMGSGQPYPLGAQIIWPQAGALPVTIPEAASPAAARDTLGLSNSLTRTYYQPTLTEVGGGGFAAFPLYTPSFYPIMTPSFGDPPKGGIEHSPVDAAITTTTPGIAPSSQTYTAFFPDSASLMLAPSSTCIVDASLATDNKDVSMFMDDEEDSKSDMDDLLCSKYSHINTGTDLLQLKNSAETPAFSTMVDIPKISQNSGGHCYAASNIFDFLSE